MTEWLDSIPKGEAFKIAMIGIAILILSLISAIMADATAWLFFIYLTWIALVVGLIVGIFGVVIGKMKNET
jgi:uncharacterized membrane protein